MSHRWARKPGVARRLLTFFASPKKVSKERRPQVRRPDGSAVGVPCATRHDRPLRNSGEMKEAREVAVGSRPQTVLADCPGRACVAQRLSWGPRSINHDCRPGFSPGPKFTNFKLGPGLNPGRHSLLVLWRRNSVDRWHRRVRRGSRFCFACFGFDCHRHRDDHSRVHSSTQVSSAFGIFHTLVSSV